MGHSHDHDAGNIKRVQIALVLTGTFMIVEVVGGILSGSLALLADAGHGRWRRIGLASLLDGYGVGWVLLALTSLGSGLLALQQAIRAELDEPRADGSIDGDRRDCRRGRQFLHP